MNVRGVIIESGVQANPGRLGRKALHCISILLACGLVHLAPLKTLRCILAGLGDGTSSTECWDSKELEAHLEKDRWFEGAEKRVKRSNGSNS